VSIRYDPDAGHDADEDTAPTRIDPARELAVLRTAVRKLRAFAGECEHTPYSPPLDRLKEDAAKVMRETDGKELRRRMRMKRRKQ